MNAMTDVAAGPRAPARRGRPDDYRLRLHANPVRQALSASTWRAV
jgi:hypothetical protein